MTTSPTVDDTHADDTQSLAAPQGLNLLGDAEAGSCCGGGGCCSLPD